MEHGSGRLAEFKRNKTDRAERGELEVGQLAGRTPAAYTHACYGDS